MTGRTIRPRPLSYTERIPVVFLNCDKDDDTPPVDPALVEFLKQCEDERQQHQLLSGLETSRVRRKAPRHSLGSAEQQQQQQLSTKHKHARKARASAAAACHGGRAVDPAATGDAARGIAVPTCREIADYTQNEEAMTRADARRQAEAGPSIPLPSLLPEVSPCLGSMGSLCLDAYVIYQDVVRDSQVEPALMQYDMDDADDKAMADINTQTTAAAAKAAGGAGARTPPATRAAAAAAAATAAALLTEDTFEALIGVLERAHFDALQQRKEQWQAEVKAERVPKLPTTEKVLPWDAAVAATKQHQPALPPLPRALYNYWLKRRKQEGGPLLEYLWYEMPWKAISFQDRTPGHEGELGDMPFMATETKNSSRVAWNRVRIDKEEVYERLMEVRDEFELLRTTADQIRKRERLKKQLLKIYRAEIAAKLGLPLHSRHGSLAAAAAGSAGAGKSTAAAAKAAAAGPSGKAAGPSAAGGPPAKRRRVAASADAATGTGTASNPGPEPTKRGRRRGAAAATAVEEQQPAEAGAPKVGGRQRRKAAQQPVAEADEAAAEPEHQQTGRRGAGRKAAAAAAKPGRQRAGKAGAAAAAAEPSASSASESSSDFETPSPSTSTSGDEEEQVETGKRLRAASAAGGSERGGAGRRAMPGGRAAKRRRMGRQAEVSGSEGSDPEEEEQAPSSASSAYATASEASMSGSEESDGDESVGKGEDDGEKGAVGESSSQSGASSAEDVDMSPPSGSNGSDDDVEMSPSPSSSSRDDDSEGSSAELRGSDTEDDGEEAEGVGRHRRSARGAASVVMLRSRRHAPPAARRGARQRSRPQRRQAAGRHASHSDSDDSDPSASEASSSSSSGDDSESPSADDAAARGSRRCRQQQQQPRLRSAAAALDAATKRPTGRSTSRSRSRLHPVSTSPSPSHSREAPPSDSSPSRSSSPAWSPDRGQQPPSSSPEPSRSPSRSPQRRTGALRSRHRQGTQLQPRPQPRGGGGGPGSKGVRNGLLHNRTRAQAQAGKALRVRFAWQPSRRKKGDISPREVLALLQDAAGADGAEAAQTLRGASGGGGGEGPLSRRQGRAAGGTATGMAKQPSNLASEAKTRAGHAGAASAEPPGKRPPRAVRAGAATASGDSHAGGELNASRAAAAPEARQCTQRQSQDRPSSARGGGSASEQPSASPPGKHRKSALGWERELAGLVASVRQTKASSGWKEVAGKGGAMSSPLLRRNSSGSRAVELASKALMRRARLRRAQKATGAQAGGGDVAA